MGKPIELVQNLGTSKSSQAAKRSSTTTMVRGFLARPFWRGRFGAGRFGVGRFGEGRWVGKLFLSQKHAIEVGLMRKFFGKW